MTDAGAGGGRLPRALLQLRELATLEARVAALEEAAGVEGAGR